MFPRPVVTAVTMVRDAIATEVGKATVLEETGGDTVPKMTDRGRTAYCSKLYLERVLAELEKAESHEDCEVIISGECSRLKRILGAYDHIKLADLDAA